MGKRVLVITIIILSILLTYSVYAQSTIAFDKTQYIGINNTVAVITVNDSSANTNPFIKDSVNVTVSSDSDLTGITLTLDETNINTGIFEGNLYFDLNNSDEANRKIKVKDYDKIYANNNSSSDEATWEKFKIISITTQDSNGNGFIDELIISFNEAADVVYDSGSSGLDCLSINDGTYSYSISSDNYSIGNPQNPLVVSLLERNTPDTGVTPTVTYSRGNTTHIIGDNCGDELENNIYSTTDGANPVLVGVELTRVLQGSKYWWNRIILKYSEPVICGDLPPGSSLKASDNDDETGGGFDTGHGGNYNSGSLSGYGSFANGGDVVVPDGEVGIIVSNNGEVSFDLGRGGNNHGSIESGSNPPSGQFTPVANSGIQDLAGNSLISTNSIDSSTPVSWDLTKPFINIAKTYDNDHDGHIDRVEFEISEDIQDGFTAANFDIAGYNGEGFNTAVTGISSGYDGNVNDNRFSITFNEDVQYDTSNTPQYSYNGNSVYLVDLAGNRLSNFSNAITQDGAPPAFSSIATGDSDKNGHIDRMTLQFSEDVTINDSGGVEDGIDCINVTGYTIVSANYSGTVTKESDFILNLVESGSYDTGVTPSVSYTTSGSSGITDSASNEMLNGETETTVDDAAPYMLTATFHDPDSNDIDQGDYITIEFDEPVKLNCTDSTDFVLLNGAYGDTFGTGSCLEDSNPGDNYIEIVLGNNPHLILPDIWSTPGENMPSGIGIKTGGTTCVVDLADNPASDTPEVDIGGSGSNDVAMVVATDGADIFTDPGSDATFIDTDISVSITLGYDALYVALWYDIGKNPDGIGTQDITDKKILATGSGKSWKAVIPATDPDIKQGANVRFILDIDGVNYYSDGSESAGGKTPWSFYIIYEQKDRVTIRNNMINPKRGDLVYINYYLAKKKGVRISVYDLAGDRVKLLKNKSESSGSHLVTWNGKNQKGQNCIPGLYYILIKIDKNRYVKKVLVIK